MSNYVVLCCTYYLYRVAPFHQVRRVNPPPPRFTLSAGRFAASAGLLRGGRSAAELLRHPAEPPEGHPSWRLRSSGLEKVRRYGSAVVEGREAVVAVYPNIPISYSHKYTTWHGISFRVLCLLFLDSSLHPSIHIHTP